MFSLKLHVEYAFLCSGLNLWDVTYLPDAFATETKVDK